MAQTHPVPESDEVAAHQYRLAQARRAQRFAEEYHVPTEKAPSLLPELYRRECLDNDGYLVPDLVQGDAAFEQRVVELLAKIAAGSGDSPVTNAP